jgi:CrcB protein
MKTILAIAIGGAMGSVARYIVTLAVSIWMKAPFPWGTLGVNLTGCFIIGMLTAAFASAQGVSPELRAFLITGFLGGFTTFSAFSMDAVGLWTIGDMRGMFVYVFASVVLSIAAAIAGSFVAWKFLV